jgi:hypothetical protein
MSRAVTLVSEHLPTEIRGLYDTFTEASKTAQDAVRAVTVAPIPERAGLKETADQANAAAQQAKDALATATSRANRQLCDTAAGAYLAHVENARRLLAEAETEMRSAASAAALHATAAARPGRPVLNTETDAASRSEGKVRSMLIVSGVRELIGLLPEDVTG